MHLDIDDSPVYVAAGGVLPVSDESGHLVQIYAHELNQPKNNSGLMLTLRYKIVSGEGVGQTGSDYLYCWGEDETVNELNKSKLAKVCKSIGMSGKLTDIAEMHNKTFRVVVTKQEGSEKYTQVKDYLTEDGIDVAKIGVEPAKKKESEPKSKSKASQDVSWLDDDDDDDDD